jgi:hypothetical protein
MRAASGMKGRAMAKITFCRPVPKIDTIASAMMITGKAMKTSMTRWRIRSILPPK